MKGFAILGLICFVIVTLIFYIGVGMPLGLSIACGFVITTLGLLTGLSGTVL